MFAWTSCRPLVPVACFVALAVGSANASASFLQLVPLPLAASQTTPTISQPIREVPGVAAQSLDSAKAVQEFGESSKVVGMTVAVVRNGQVLYRGHYGFENREDKVESSEGTIMRFASVSKPITATAIMRLADAGRIDIDLPIRHYVPDWPSHHPSLTTRQILAHLSGIRHYQPGKNDNSGRFYESLTEALNVFKNDDLVHRPGSTFLYSTHAYTLAGVALERASGSSFRAAIRNMLSGVAPSVDVEVRSQNKPRRSAMYVLTSNGNPVRIPNIAVEDNSWKYPGGGLEGTAVDLALFGDAVYRARIVSAAGRDAMWTAQLDGDGRSTGYGLGWATSADAVSHSGSQQGARSFLLIGRRDGTVVAVLTNTNITAQPSALAEQLMRIWSQR